MNEEKRTPNAEADELDVPPFFWRGRKWQWFPEGMRYEAELGAEVFGLLWPLGQRWRASVQIMGARGNQQISSSPGDAIDQAVAWWQEQVRRLDGDHAQEVLSEEHPLSEVERELHEAGIDPGETGGNLRPFRVGVFREDREGRKTRYSAYTRDFNPAWPGCRVFDLRALNGEQAKREAIAKARAEDKMGAGT